MNSWNAGLDEMPYDSDHGPEHDDEELVGPLACCSEWASKVETANGETSYRCPICFYSWVAPSDPSVDTPVGPAQPSIEERHSALSADEITGVSLHPKAQS